MPILFVYALLSLSGNKENNFKECSHPRLSKALPDTVKFHVSLETQTTMNPRQALSY